MEATRSIKRARFWIAFFGLLLLLGCQPKSTKIAEEAMPAAELILTEAIDSITVETTAPLSYDSTFNTIHIYVALCDNFYQGIVPVPEKIGDGQDPKNNLYWGCGYGVKTFFKRSADWMLIETREIDSLILERAIFKHSTKNYYLIADAYNGKYIKQCTVDFMASTSGIQKDTLQVKDRVLGIAGNAKLLGYIGHNGLMDFDLAESYKNEDGIQRSTIILACYSQHYFSQILDQQFVTPLVWTASAMAPEAYTIHDAIGGFIANETNVEILEHAISAYAKHQKCSNKAAARILVSGY